MMAVKMLAKYKMKMLAAGKVEWSANPSYGQYNYYVDDEDVEDNDDGGEDAGKV